MLYLYFKFLLVAKHLVPTARSAWSTSCREFIQSFASGAYGFLDVGIHVNANTDPNTHRPTDLIQNFETEHK